MKRLVPVIVVTVALMAVLSVNVSTPKPAEAAIHQIIAALCNGGPGVIVPPGQSPQGPSSIKKSDVRALLATGFITDITVIDNDAGDGKVVIVSFDPTVKNSKFIVDPGHPVHDKTRLDFFPDGADLIMSPHVVPDPNFPGHANCPNFPS